VFTATGLLTLIIGMCRMRDLHGHLCSKTLLWVSHLAVFAVSLAIEITIVSVFSQEDTGVPFYLVEKQGGTLAVIYCIANSFVTMFLLGRFWILSRGDWHKHLEFESSWNPAASSALASKNKRVSGQLENESLLTTTTKSVAEQKKRPEDYLVLDTELFYQFCD